MFNTAHGEVDLNEVIKHDASLLIPGFGASGIVLGEDSNSVIRRFKKHELKLSKPKKGDELFKSIFKISCSTKIYFDSLYYNDERKISFFVFHGKIVSIIGLDLNKATIDAVSLLQGVNNFIFHYGNKNLYIYKSGTHGIYLYPGLGIAIVDDDMNDTIDMYLVFKP